MNVRELKDQKYGPHDRNVLDAYLVQRKDGKPAPVLLFFHGGGYLFGDKSHFTEFELMNECLEAGISVVSCNYRFIDEHPFPAPMHDGTRAIQFVRSKAKEWHIDGDRLATSGSSAGGHIALWNALKGNLANLKSDDPIERLPSNVCVFIGFATQVSKDQRFYEGIYEGPHIQPNLAMFYGLENDDQLYEPENLALAEQASAIHYMSEAAPPAFMTYSYVLQGLRIPADAEVGVVIHHPVHGLVLKQKYDELGIPYVLRHEGEPAKPGEMIAFLNRYLGN